MKYYNKTNISEAWIEVDSFSKYVDEMKKQSQTMNYLLLAIWSISLLVWWIWVMNIMLVSVTERTKEIWIRKALWALKWDIIIQFLVESILISLIWGVIAIIFSYWIARLINKYWWEMWFHALITWNVVVMALVITSVTWIIFWILPARRAAKLNVIDALRYE
jgi:ABC-type antimicrobial peptide transport system permease subunit